ILVNSVDEYRRLAGTSSSIAAGCGLTPLIEGGRETQEIGTVFFEDCKADAPYHSSGIRRVADVAIVLWENRTPRVICQPIDVSVDANGYWKDPVYQKCIVAWIERALRDLFRTPEVASSSALVMPALGTGAGGVNPEITYQTY